MLVLSRKVGEKICVPECRLVLTILEVRGGAVRLGIAAPDEITVVREELLRDGPKHRGNAVAVRNDAVGPLASH